MWKFQLHPKEVKIKEEDNIAKYDKVAPEEELKSVATKGQR